jgi:hypothetical protein
MLVAAVSMRKRLSAPFIWRITTGRRSQRCSGISAELAVGFAVVSAFEFAFVLGTVWALARGGCVANQSKSSKLVRATGSKPGAMRITSSMALNR